MIETMSRGSDYELVFSVQNPDSSAKDLSGTLQLKFAMAKYPSDLVPALMLTLDDPELTITDPPNGKVKVNIKTELLGELDADRVYFMELWQENALGEKSTLEAHNVLVKDAIIN